MADRLLDAARLDALEAAMRERGELLLHNEASPTGRLGLGLMQRRSLREAIDTAYGPFAALPPVVTPSREAPRERFWRAVCAEIDHAYAKHGREPWGRHEFYAIMLEEVDEVWAEIKGDTPTADMLKEVVQVAAMCLRYAETGDRYRGEHPEIPLRAVPTQEAK